MRRRRRTARGSRAAPAQARRSQRLSGRPPPAAPAFLVSSLPHRSPCRYSNLGVPPGRAPGETVAKILAAVPERRLRARAIGRRDLWTVGEQREILPVPPRKAGGMRLGARGTGCRLGAEHGRSRGGRPPARPP